MRVRPFTQGLARVGLHVGKPLLPTVLFLLVLNIGSVDTFHSEEEKRSFLGSHGVPISPFYTSPRVAKQSESDVPLR